LAYPQNRRDEAFQNKVRFFAIVPKDQFRPLTERWCFENK